MHLDWVVLTRLVQSHAENPGQLPSAKTTHCKAMSCNEINLQDIHKFCISTNSDINENVGCYKTLILNCSITIYIKLCLQKLAGKKTTKQ